MNKINLESYRNNPSACIHFIGCEGAGSRPLRKIFDQLGFQTSGSDLTLNGHCRENVPDTAQLLVVYSSAVTPDNPEMLRAAERNVPCIRRGEALGLLAELYPFVISVSGTHGKTSVSAMIAYILQKNGLEPGFLIGGTVREWNESGAAGNGKIFVCEADESDGTHTALHSEIAVVTNVEDDHSWNFAEPDQLYRNFQTFAQQGKKLIAPPIPLLEGHPDYRKIHDPDEYKHNEKFKHFGYFSRIDLKIAVEAVTATGLLSEEDAENAAATFPGVARRMQKHAQHCSFDLYEDYAHHPTEVAASLRSFRELFPGRKLAVIFQPHRYARLKQYFHQFAEELAKADKIFVTPVFAAWTGSADVTAQDLVREIGSHAQYISGTWEEMALSVRQNLQYGDVAAVIGAGDIQKILEPLKTMTASYPDVGVIIPAGGSSARYGEKNKLFEDLNGLPVVIRTLLGIAPGLTGEKKIFMPVPESLRNEFENTLRQYLPPEIHVTLVPGGKTRTESVRNALRAMPPEIKIVAVHDAARPFITPQQLSDCVCACERYGAAIIGHPVTDTVKRADPNGMIAETVSRENLWAVQTPQVFKRELLEEAYAAADRSGQLFTDDAALIEAFTHTKVYLVKGPDWNRKITFQEDMISARQFFSSLPGKE